MILATSQKTATMLKDEMVSGKMCTSHGSMEEVIHFVCNDGIYLATNSVYITLFLALFESDSSTRTRLEEMTVYYYGYKSSHKFRR